MKWISEDPASKSGIARWDGTKLISTTVMRKMGAKGKYKLAEKTYSSRHEATLASLEECKQVVIEEGFGKFTAAVKHQAEIRGYVRCACDSLFIPMVVINVSEWRRVIKEAYGISWPATRDRKKALSIQLVKLIYDINVTDDEADAVLLGVAAQRMGLVENIHDEILSKVPLTVKWCS